jgi:hypothetical protein
MSVVMEAKKTIEDQLSAKPFSDNMLNDIDQLFKLIMIRKHPNVSDANFDILIDIAIKDAELTGYVSKSTLKQFYNLFSWVYIQGTLMEHSAKH